MFKPPGTCIATQPSRVVTIPALSEGGQSTQRRFHMSATQRNPQSANAKFCSSVVSTFIRSAMQNAKTQFSRTRPSAMIRKGKKSLLGAESLNFAHCVADIKGNAHSCLLLFGFFFLRIALRVVLRTNGNAAFLCSLLSEYQPSSSLRSISEKLLVIPKINTKSQGQRSFSYQAPTIWNALPHPSVTLLLCPRSNPVSKVIFQKAFSLQP